MKKILVMLFALAMIFAFGVTSMATNNPTVTVSTEPNAERGSEVTVTVSFANNPGIFAITMPIEFDETRLERVSFEGSAGLNWTIGDTALGENSSLSNYYGNGVMLTLKFKVKDDAPGGKATVSIGEVTATNASAEAINFTVIPGGVTVSVTCTHNNTEIRDEKIANCKEPGYTGDTWCTDCSTKIATGKVTVKDPTNHVGGTELKNIKAANCKEQGYTGDTCCKGCGAVLTAGTAIEKDATNHVGGTELKNVKTANCKEQGYTGDNCCKGCGIVLTAGTKTAKNPANHVGETEIRDAKNATCTEKGYSGDTYCLGCDSKIADGRETDTVAHSGGTATCQNKAVCEVCHQPYGELAAHKYGEWVIIKDSTYSEPGLKKRTCAVCQKEITEIIPVKHNYSSDPIVIGENGSKEDDVETNPNTGAPMIAIVSAVAVVSAAAVAIMRKNK